MYSKICFVLAFALIAISCNKPATAQDLPGKKDSVNSTILKEKRFFQVVLPQNYKPGSKDKYDVLYVIDGEGNTKLISTIQQFIENEGFMPPTIIVGIFNTDRNRDLTPTYVKDFGISGGAANFLAFIKQELMPYIDKTYPTDGDNTLFGHSFGGLFAVYTLLNDPSVFNSYIAADPSFWWDKNYMIKQAAGKLSSLANLNKNLYISGREGHGLIEMSIPPMDSLLKKQAPAGLTWEVKAYPGETHGSVRLKSMYDGLRFTYGGFSSEKIQLHPMSGIILKNKPIKLWCLSDTAKVRYTLDGTLPTLSSAKMQANIILQGPAKITVKKFANRDKYSVITTGEFVEGNYLSPAKKPKGMTPGGFNYAYYEGEWDKLPDFSKLKPVKTGITDSSFNVSKLPHKNNFALLINGQIEIKEDGYYTFALFSDDGSKLYIDNRLIIDNDGLHNANDPRSYVLPLQKGFYPVRIEYFQKDGDSNLRFVYVTPASRQITDAAPIPFALQYGVAK